MWIGKSLSDTFFRLQSRFHWAEFGSVEASRVLARSRDHTALDLSRLVRAGWLERVGRGRYVALDPRWGRWRTPTDPLARLRTQSFFPALVSAVAGAVQLYGPRLRGIAFFGSAARLDHTPESDVDLLLVVDPLPAALGDRLDELRALRTPLSSASVGPHRDGKYDHRAQFVPITSEELRSEPPLLLDLTQDALILFDPEQLLSEALQRLRRKLIQHGARRVVPAEGPPFWVLHPGARVGQIAEL